MKLYVGIDGGGTKTEFLACNESGKILNRIVKGSGNPIDIGVEMCVSVLKDGIDDLSRNLDGYEIHSIYAGISGGSTGNCKEKINAELRKIYGNNLIIENDTDGLNSMLFEFGKGDGCCVISGTGSVGFARKNNEIYRTGGYGYLIDKGGSGFDYGRDAIYYALCDIDGRGEKTALTDILFSKIGDIRENVQKIYIKGKKYIASFAPVVFEAYRMGDKTAQRIVEDNTREISKIFNALAKIENKEVCRTILSGSVFRDFDIIKKHLENHLEYKFDFIEAQEPPVCGAVVGAAINAGINDISEFKKNLNASLKR